MAKAYACGLTIPGKVIVCGHRTAAYGYMFDPVRTVEDSSPFFSDGIIAIDAGTYLFRQVNIVVLEDETAEGN